MFSVIIPNFNSARTILDTLNSVREAAKQFDPNLVEIILVDNGSTDSSPSIIRSWHQTHPDISFKFFSEPTPKSPGLARNMGIKKSKFPYILFLDADDNFHVKIFSKLKKHIRDETETIFFNYHIIESIDNLKKSRTLQSYSSDKLELLMQYVTLSTDNSTIAILFKKDLLVKKEIFFESGFYEDIYFLAQVITKAEQIDFLDEKLYLKKIMRESITSTLTCFHIYCYTKAWKSVHGLLLSYKPSSLMIINIDKSIRGLIGQMVMKIDRASFSESSKEQLRLYLASCITRLFPKVEKSLLGTENTLLDQYAINFVKCYNHAYEK